MGITAETRGAPGFFLWVSVPGIVEALPHDRSFRCRREGSCGIFFLGTHQVHNFSLRLSTMPFMFGSFLMDSSIFRQAWITVVWSFLLKA